MLNETNDIFEIGLSRQDITPPPNGEVMMGWGDVKHRAEKVELPLYSRAVVLKDPSGGLIAMACLEICFITQALRDEVLDQLNRKDPDGNWTEHSVLLSATHTHCAPGGHTHDTLYNLPSSGFYPHVIQKYATGTAAAILEAKRSSRPGRIRFAEGTFAYEQPVAFNRSIAAWNRNPEVTKYKFEERSRALDRTMRLFRFETLDGLFLGCLNEFAVHCTSVHRDYNVIHSDNKGVAAANLEKEMGGVCIFVQGAAGDVSPNFQRFKGLVETRGTNRDDLIAVQDNGKLQASMAKSLVEQACRSAALRATVDTAIDYVDFSKIEVDPVDVNGKVGCKTGPAVIGARALLGTDEGMPTPKALYYMAHVFSFLADVSVLLRGKRKRNELFGSCDVQGPKIGCVQSGESTMFRAERFENFPLPGWVDPIVGQMKKWDRQKLMSTRPMTPQIIPIQAVKLGHFVFVAVPAEFTTTSGARLKSAVAKEMGGDTKCVLVGYANAYSGYVTTPEEYQVQLYEGASTHFGQWTQPAYQTVFRRLVKAFTVSARDRKVKFAKPPKVPPQEISLLRSQLSISLETSEERASLGI